jgi:DNA-binding response OmpR family regulator
MTSTARPQVCCGLLNPSTPPSQVRHGDKILVVEGSYLLAELLCEFLRDFGMEPIGPAARMRDWCPLARRGAINGAILDMVLGEDRCFAIAAILKTCKVSFIFLTGCREKSPISLEFCSAPLVRKPFEDDKLSAALDLILGHPTAISSGHRNGSDGLRFGSVHQRS